MKKVQRIWSFFGLSVRGCYFTCPSAASVVPVSRASLNAPTPPIPTAILASGWFKSKAGDSERMRGIEVKS